MIGESYWTTGIELSYTPDDGDGLWAASLDFYDGGFCQAESTEGRLHTRYYMSSPEQAVRLLKSDALKLGIKFRSQKSLYVECDGECEDVCLPDNWRKILERVAAATGFESPYTEMEA